MTLEEMLERKAKFIERCKIKAIERLANPPAQISNLERVENIRAEERKYKTDFEVPEDAPF